MGKCRDLTEFERGLIVGARSAGCSISETVTRLGFSKTAVSRIYREWCGKKKTRSTRGTGGRKRLVDELGERRMERVVEANSRATVTEIQNLYNCSAETPISLKTTQRALKRLGYSRRAPRKDPAGVRSSQPGLGDKPSPKEHKQTSADLSNTEQDINRKIQAMFHQDGAPADSNQTVPGIGAPLPGSQCW